MRSLLVVCLVACVALVAGTANAGGQISDNTLAQMGLSGLQTMSDLQGTEVRGMGFAAVGGISVASSGHSVAADGYVAVSTGSNALAAGASVSSVKTTGIFNIPVSGVVAAGGAVAFAK